jgi:superfamily II DNA or RNA helicase
LAGWLYVPYNVIGNEQAVHREKKKLTYLPKFAETKDDFVLLYEDFPRLRALGVPRAYGMERFGHLLNVHDMRTMGERMGAVPRLPDPHHPSVKDPLAQAKFMADLEASARLHGSFLAEAPTGSGKTVCAIRTAVVIGRKTIICVHLERLLDQWLKEIASKTGLPESRIGYVQGDHCDWRNKDFVVAMMPSMAQRAYEPEFYQTFGTAIYDEVHRVGAPLLGRTAHLFPAHHRWGFSATMYRKDGGERGFFWHIGPVRVTSQADALPMTVYVKNYTAFGDLWGKTHGSRMQCLSQDWSRNNLLVTFIRRLHRAGRQTLIVGDSVQHLQHLMDLCAQNGVSREDMGQFTSERHILQKYINDKGVEKTRVRKIKIKPEELDAVQANAQLIFATYGMMTEGIDIPRLNAGIDVLPRGDATQLIGRIRRPMPGKPEPVWITLRDTKCFMSKKYFDRRVKDYQTTGAIVKDGVL